MRKSIIIILALFGGYYCSLSFGSNGAESLPVVRDSLTANTFRCLGTILGLNRWMENQTAKWVMSDCISIGEAPKLQCYGRPIYEFGVRRSWEKKVQTHLFGVPVLEPEARNEFDEYLARNLKRRSFPKRRPIGNVFYSGPIQEAPNHVLFNLVRRRYYREKLYQQIGERLVKLVFHRVRSPESDFVTWLQQPETSTHHDFGLMPESTGQPFVPVMAVATEEVDNLLDEIERGINFYDYRQEVGRIDSTLLLADLLIGYPLLRRSLLKLRAKAPEAIRQFLEKVKDAENQPKDSLVYFAYQFPNRRREHARLPLMSLFDLAYIKESGQSKLYVFTWTWAAIVPGVSLGDGTYEYHQIGELGD